MGKIRLDKSGRPYVITNGGVYRPQAGPHEYPVPQRNWGKGIESKISTDAEVQVKHVGQSPFCKVRTGDGVEEMWTVHGHDVKSPEACFFERQATKAAMPKPNWLAHQLITGDQLVEQLNRPRMKG